MQESDTICAISTPVGEGGISIIRLSGPAAVLIADRVLRLKKEARLDSVDSHTIHYGHVVNDETVIDEVMVSVFRSPRSYTREDMVEINAHGGVVLTREILSLLIAAGARVAEAGEFTKRAFLSGRIDLTQAEAVIDIIKAKSDLSAKAAVAQLEGRLSTAIAVMKDRLLKAHAHIEAYLDFPDEEAQLFDDQTIRQEVREVIAHFQSIIDSYKNGAVIREGVHTVLVGRPNVGKSSLLNVLLNRDRALVSDYPGTTRDALEELIEIEGVLFRLVDTAGIMQSPQHELDYMSIERTKEHYGQGDLILLVLDAAQGLTNEDTEILKMVGGKECIVVGNKIDLGKTIDEDALAQCLGRSMPIHYLSVETKEGVSALEKALVAFVWKGKKKESDVLITRVRHKEALEKARDLLQRVLHGLEAQQSLELIACDMKEALGAVREIIGEVYSSDVLNMIFDEFCIGK